MDAETIFLSLEQINYSIEQHKNEIEKLDREIGDGDHIFNIQRGIKEALSLKNEFINKTTNDVLKNIGMKIMTTMGGASGALFATLLLTMSKQYDSKLSDDENIVGMFSEGVEAMKKRGKSNLGEKTMLDVLIPVSDGLKKLVGKDDTQIIVAKIKQIAAEGMLSTQDLIATKGRASFLGERSKGHIDPGARSSQLVIEAICDTISKSKN
jgi:dihydroxyacetone kinase-like protein